MGRYFPKQKILNFYLFFVTSLAGAAELNKKEKLDPLVAPAVVQLNALALDLYGQLLAADSDKSFCISPYGLSTVLGMATLGARENTEAELCKVLHWQADGKAKPQPHAARALRGHLLQVTQKQADLEFQSVSRVWVQSGQPILKNFLNDCGEFYGSDAYGLNFEQKPAASAVTINQWFNKETKQRIPKLFDPAKFSNETRLLLTNAVYFHGKWEKPFKAQDSQERPFLLANGKRTTAVFMYDERKIPYGEDSSVQVARLPYRGDRCSLLLIVPRQKQGLAELEKKFTAKQFDEWNRELNPHMVRLYLPKFKITSEQNFKEPLQALGLDDALKPERSHFHAIRPRGRENLFIKDVLQKVDFELDEEGTVAAAATVIKGGFGGGLSQPKDLALMNLNHPFLYAVRDDASGALLFLGRMSKPNPESIEQELKPGEVIADPELPKRMDGGFF